MIIKPDMQMNEMEICVNEFFLYDMFAQKPKGNKITTYGEL
jgi:hypothetical protein